MLGKRGVKESLRQSECLARHKSSESDYARLESLGCAFGLRRTIKATLPIF